MTALTQYRPRNEMDFFRRDPFFGRLFDGWFDELNENVRQWSPNLDLVEHGDHYEALIDLPGMDPKNIEVNLQNDVLTVRGQRSFEHEERDEDTKVLRRETFSGRFERSIRLPGGVDADKVKAKGENGVLKITLPKAKEAIGRRIQIES